MLFLKGLNEIGFKCVSCGIDLTHIALVRTEACNVYSYTLQNKEYPLKFKRSYVFSGDDDCISIEINDRININRSNKDDVASIQFYVNCPNYHYHTVVCNLIPKEEGSFVHFYQASETLKVFDYEIYNNIASDMTLIYNTGKKPYDIIMNINLVPLSKWNPSDKEKMKEKINKMLLLK